jgi:hypothetical protein
MLDHGLVGELNKRLGVCERLGSLVWWFARKSIAGHASRPGAREGHTSGRRRVPKPPTRMMATWRVSELCPVQPLSACTFHVGGGVGVLCGVGRRWTKNQDQEVMKQQRINAIPTKTELAGQR